MILLSELKEFAMQWQAERGNVESYYLVASDDKLIKVYQEAAHHNTDYSMVVLIPIHLADIPNEDHRKLDNLLSFMFIKKTDDKAGAAAELNVFMQMQQEAKDFVIKVLDMYQRNGSTCVFRNMDLNSIRIDPVANYLGSHGYSVDFTNKTNLI